MHSSLNKMNFSYNTKVVSEPSFEEHIKLYQNYVDKTNEICADLRKHTELIQQANQNYSHYRALKKELSYCLNGVALHEIYFRNLGVGDENPGEYFTELASESFNSFEQWCEDFVATAMSARGWVTCCYEQRTGCIVNVLQDSYSEDLVVNMYPLLVLDMYEHAFYYDYLSDREKYVKCFVNCIRWDTVEKRAKNIKGGDTNGQ